MPIIHAHVWKGFGEDPAKKVIKGITNVFVDLGIPKTHWGIGGEPASEKFKDVGGGRSV
jgi:4-oxalocrotonate tautomerase